jgi:DNA polymerase (family 10)
MVGGVGLDETALEEQAVAVAEVAADASIEVFHGVETNVDAEGDLSTDDDTLADLDLVVASPHAALGQDREAATERLVRAVSHPAVDVLGHPTGRLINSRPGLDLDLQRVVEAAVEHDTAIELNANPNRLDAGDEFVRLAVEAGATVAVDTDAHSPAEFEYVRYGVHTARRGWAGPGDVLNCRDVDGLREFLH